MSNTRFYKHYRSMHDRMLPSYIDAHSYVNINICLRWNKFNFFLRDMYDEYCLHVKKYGKINTTLERINVHGNYCKKNCRWATKGEQSLNKKNTVKVVFNGQEVALKTLCDDLDKKYCTVYTRLKRGKGIEDALFLKPWKRKRHEM